MPRIRVDPAQLRALSAQLEQVAGDLQSLGGRIGGAIGSLDWEVRQKAGVDGRVNDARGYANATASQAYAMARYLLSKAQAFEEADQQGMTATGQIAAGFAVIQQQWAQGLYGFPTDTVSAQLRLGQVIGEPSTLAVPAIIPTLAAEVDRLKTILLAGRTKLGGWVPDLRRNPWRKIKSGTPAGFLIDVALEFIGHPDEWNVRGAEIAITKTGIDLLIGSTGIGFLALTANAAVQLGGSVFIWGSTGVARVIAVDPMQDRILEENARRMQQGLDRIDLGEITRSVAATIVDLENARWQALGDAQRAVWQQPSVSNVLRLGLLQSPGVGEAAALPIDPQALAVTAQNIMTARERIADFALGLWDLGPELVRYQNTVAHAITSGLLDRLKQSSFQLLDVVLPPSN